SVLPGWSVFTRFDARAAFEALLADGPVRAKSPYARGGNHQVVFTDLRQAQAWLDSPAAIGIEHGLVLERDLVAPESWSVGAARIGAHAIADCGSQKAVGDHRGNLVYGGTRLAMFRGGLPQLCASLADGDKREAVCTA